MLLKLNFTEADKIVKRARTPHNLNLNNYTNNMLLVPCFLIGYTYHRQ